MPKILLVCVLLIFISHLPARAARRSCDFALSLNSPIASAGLNLALDSAIFVNGIQTSVGVLPLETLGDFAAFTRYELQATPGIANSSLHRISEALRSFGRTFAGENFVRMGFSRRLASALYRADFKTQDVWQITQEEFAERVDHNPVSWRWFRRYLRLYGKRGDQTRSKSDLPMSQSINSIICHTSEGPIMIEWFEDLKRVTRYEFKHAENIRPEQYNALVAKMTQENVRFAADEFIKIGFDEKFASELYRARLKVEDLPKLNRTKFVGRLKKPDQWSEFRDVVNSLK